MLVHWRRKWQTTPVFLLSETNSTKRQKDVTLEGERPQEGRCQYTTAEEWREITSSSRKNEAAGTKWERQSVVDVYGDESKVRCCKEQYCIGI